MLAPIFESMLARILHAAPRERLARAVGRLTSARLPRSVLDPIVAKYVQAFDVDLREALVPPGGFDSFDAFFARQLRAGARPIDPSSDALISPSDGALVDAGLIDSNRTLTIKGQPYRAGDLLDGDGEPFERGFFAVIYLSPRDYHRVHVPCDATVDRVHRVPGTLFPVNAFGVRHVPQLFARNERVVVSLRSAAFGRVAVVLVGAGIVGRIDLAIPGPPRPPIDGRAATQNFRGDVAPTLRKGDELGSFVLGSTVIVFVERCAPAGLRMVPALGAAVRVGEPLLRHF